MEEIKEREGPMSQEEFAEIERFAIDNGLLETPFDVVIKRSRASRHNLKNEATACIS